jgi:hypothetical protein
MLPPTSWSTSILNMEAAFTSKTSTASPTATQRNNRRTESTSVINRRKSLQSVSTLFKYVLFAQLCRLCSDECEGKMISNGQQVWIWTEAVVIRYPECFSWFIWLHLGICSDSTIKYAGTAYFTSHNNRIILIRCYISCFIDT